MLAVAAGPTSADELAKHFADEMGGDVPIEE